MNVMPESIPFKPEWPDADLRLLRADRPEPPVLPLDDVFSPRWAHWMRGAAASKGAPPDYIMAALLVVCSTLIGNTRWTSPWNSWAEPPVIWAMNIGNPSAGKSPAIDAVLVPLRRAERKLREAARDDVAAWSEKAEIAHLAERAWKEEVKAAIKAGEEPPARPDAANAGPQPVMPCLALSDATIEKLAGIVAGQPRGTLLARDELAGWLQSMTRYAGGGSDRPFWLEAYGGRSFSVERMGRDPVYVDRLTIGVLGGIQPDRLRNLLMKSDDDGLLARFIPVWPQPAPVKRPESTHNEAFLEDAISRLLSLEMSTDGQGHQQPWMVPFENSAQDAVDRFRQSVRNWEEEAEGLLLSYLGKLPGIAVRLSLVIALMEWASGETSLADKVTLDHFERAALLVESYLVPMTRRAYAEQSGGPAQKSARALVALIRGEAWTSFTAREVRRKQRSHLQSMEVINQALKILETDDLIRPVECQANPKGGAPKRIYSVNPVIFENDE